MVIFKRVYVGAGVVGSVEDYRPSPDDEVSLPHCYIVTYRLHNDYPTACLAV